ncbi:hypothetical protein C1H46_028074 [Malus baccata]|uniref:Uncharacterized protein n=1 Tax=Malus baccata TaxID=106549 RepID=A0A540LIS5_MALBA|nr:hypothetical protein C1H46_028074 [Malus baccata]
MANCLEELDNAIAKLHQNFQELRYHLEKSFLEQGRALLKFEAQWKDLKKDHSRENEQRQVHLQQMWWVNFCQPNACFVAVVILIILAVPFPHHLGRVVI